MLLRGRRIFLVEDNIGNQTITKTLLESHGALTAVHRTGLDIISHLRDFLPIDLIILDLMLPDGVTGYDVLASIRRHEAFDDIPVIAISVIDRSEVIPVAKRYGFTGFISKPINFQTFTQQIADIIDGEKTW